MSNSNQEPPVYIAHVASEDTFTNASVDNAVERYPVRAENVWFEIDQIPDPPPAGVDGVVTKFTDEVLTPVAGAANRFGNNANFADMVPSAAAASDSAAYRPVLKDKAGKEVPYDLAVWVADGALGVVEFRNGVPAGYDSAQFTITFWKYTGNIVSSSSGGGVFERSGDIIRPEGTSWASDDFVVGSDQLDFDTAAKASRVFFDKTRSAFRAGYAGDTAWDSANVGDNSFAVNRNCRAKGGTSFAAGHNNLADAENSLIVGGYDGHINANAGTYNAMVSCNGGTITGNGGDHSTNLVAVIAGQSHAVSGGHFSAVVGGQNAVMEVNIAANGDNTARGYGNVILGGDNQHMDGDANHCAIVGGGSSTIGDRNSIGGASDGSAIVAGVGCAIAGAANSLVGGANAAAAFSNCFVWGDGSAATAAESANQFVVRCSQGAKFFTTNAVGDQATVPGPYLDNNSASWLTPSSRDIKDLHSEVSGAEALERVERLTIYRWSYKAQDPGYISVGPVAEDWHREFPSSKSTKTIDAIDPVGVALACVRGLNDIAKAHKTQIEAIAAAVADLGAEANPASPPGAASPGTTGAQAGVLEQTVRRQEQTIAGLGARLAAAATAAEAADARAREVEAAAASAFAKIEILLGESRNHSQRIAILEKDEYSGTSP